MADTDSTTRDFHHPYEPYAIQEQFMQCVYDVCEGGKIGILESPTGTGKSLSLICGSLTWLRDFKGKEIDEALSGTAEENSNLPAWIVEQARERRKREFLREREELQARLVRIRAREKAQKARFQKGEQPFKRRKVDSSSKDEDDDDQFVLDDYESDREANAQQKKTDPASGLSVATMALMDQLGLSRKQEQEEEEPDDEMKIFFCSRTHSQLTQFVNELRRVKMPPALDVLPDSEEGELRGSFKHLSLGSRKNLCINPTVNKLRSVTSINERCLELQQSTTASDKKCGFLPNKENTPLVNDFRDHTLATVRDIEDLAILGKEIGICPYYASRSVIKPSEIVTLPYPLLLQKSAREALGLNLKGHVVIIDEAHNLMDAISGIHGISVSLNQIKRSRAQLGIYLQKFRNKLKGKNRVYVAQLVRLLDSLAGYLEQKSTAKSSEGNVDSTELLSGKGADQINLYKLNKYLQESKIARKVEGYIIYEETKTANHANDRKTPAETSTPTLQHIQGLIYALTNPSKEGQLLYSKTEDRKDISIRYMLLDPTYHFKEIVSEARAVVLAGGTMSPMSDYVHHLFPYLEPEKIQTLSCEHVIPDRNLMAWPVEKGPAGVTFEFTFDKRNDPSLLDELGRTVLNMCVQIPDGVVIFFPSYAYLAIVVEHWQKKAAGAMSVWDRLGSRKALFRESKETTSVEEVLGEYARAIDAGKGGLLLSVVGGKMSEGINFSDRLGRGVMIVGLPYPNVQSAEWKAKIEYIERSTYDRLGEITDSGPPVSESERRAAGKHAGREFYENACMRAVNQSIGRAIRHRGDYAVIILLDRRFATERITSKLPGWIQHRVQTGKKFGEIMSGLSSFFRDKKTM